MNTSSLGSAVDYALAFVLSVPDDSFACTGIFTLLTWFRCKQPLCRYLLLFLLYINIKIGENKC